MTFDEIREKDNTRMMKAYNRGRVDELDKISEFILLGCEKIECENCPYEEYSQDVCQQAYTVELIENYIFEQLKENSNG